MKIDLTKKQLTDLAAILLEYNIQHRYALRRTEDKEYKKFLTSSISRIDNLAKFFSNILERDSSIEEGTEKSGGINTKRPSPPKGKPSGQGIGEDNSEVKELLEDIIGLLEFACNMTDLDCEGMVTAQIDNINKVIKTL